MRRASLMLMPGARCAWPLARQPWVNEVRGRSDAVDADGGGGGVVPVVVVDPRSVLAARGKGMGALKGMQAAELQVPRAFLAKLQQGTMQLGDHDDPLNAWSFGRADEVFRYRLAGWHKAQSGFTSVITRAALQSVLEGGNGSSGGSSPAVGWAELVEQVQQQGDVSPFLFVGRVVEADAASVYTLHGSGNGSAQPDVEGLLISSAAAEYED